MALFNLRWPGRAAQDDGKRGARQRRATPAESVDALRRRARHRLIGAAVLLVAGVVGFPLLFDTQPRPIAADIPISIPDRGQAPAPVAPSPAAVAAAPAPAAVAAAPAPAPVTAASRPAPSPGPATAESLDKGEEAIASSPARPEKSAAPAPATRPSVKPPEPAHETHREAAVAAKPPAPAVPAARVEDDAARARALLDGRPSPAPATASTAPAPAGAEAGRFVVQVGAFADTGKAQEARNKLTRGGLKTYVQSVDTKDGKRLRVRVGPFANKAEADRAAAKVKGLDLPASILIL